MTSNLIYGEACGNMHGDLREAVKEGIITLEDEHYYNNYGIKIMSGRWWSGDVEKIEKIQEKLDKFWGNEKIEHEKIDYENKENWIF